MSIQTGDTVTIRRGKLAGGTGEVIAINTDDCVLKFPNGTFSTQKLSNVKAPDVPTINADDLAAAIQDQADETATNEGMYALYALAGRLDSILPGIKGLVTWPDEKAEG